MNNRELLYSWIPGLEKDVVEARKALKAADEIEFRSWAEQFTKLPEPVLRELWAVQRRREG